MAEPLLPTHHVIMLLETSHLDVLAAFHALQARARTGRRVWSSAPKTSSSSWSTHGRPVATAITCFWSSPTLGSSMPACPNTLYNF